MSLSVSLTLHTTPHASPHLFVPRSTSLPTPLTRPAGGLGVSETSEETTEGQVKRVRVTARSGSLCSPFTLVTRHSHSVPSPVPFPHSTRSSVTPITREERERNRTAGEGEVNRTEPSEERQRPGPSRQRNRHEDGPNLCFHVFPLLTPPPFHSHPGPKDPPTGRRGWEGWKGE